MAPAIVVAAPRIVIRSMPAPVGIAIPAAVVPGAAVPVGTVVPRIVPVRAVIPGIMPVAAIVPGIVEIPVPGIPCPCAIAPGTVESAVMPGTSPIPGGTVVPAGTVAEPDVDGRGFSQGDSGSVRIAVEADRRGHVLRDEQGVGTLPAPQVNFRAFGLLDEGSDFFVGSRNSFHGRGFRPIVDTVLELLSRGSELRGRPTRGEGDQRCKQGNESCFHIRINYKCNIKFVSLCARNTFFIRCKVTK